MNGNVCAVRFKRIGHLLFAENHLCCAIAYHIFKLARRLTVRHAGDLGRKFFYLLCYEFYVFMTGNHNDIEPELLYNVKSLRSYGARRAEHAYSFDGFIHFQPANATNSGNSVRISIIGDVARTLSKRSRTPPCPGKIFP